MTAIDMEALAPVNSPARAAERIFQACPYHAIRYLKCEFRDGVLTIHGRLPSYHLKQVAQSMVLNLDGVDRIRNLTEVAVT